MKKVSLFLLTLACAFRAHAQNPSLTLNQQKADFEIFVGGLNEGHAGLYYFIDKSTFEKKCDSIQGTFKEGLSREDFYLKLRFLIASLRHGHTRISLPTNGNINYKMAVLDASKKYLPFQFLIANDKLIVLEDCSKEQLIPVYSVVKSINDVSSKDLIQKMLPYMPADGINQTYKYFNLYNYYYFHYLFNLFYPNKKGIKVELEKNNTHFYLETLSPKVIDSIYYAKNKKSISAYGQQLDYKSNLINGTAYLRVSSFYKGLIESFGQQYESFLDSSFADMGEKGSNNLILDLRDNEGGGDSYDNILFSYLNESAFTSNGVMRVAGRQFKYKQYASNSSEAIKAYMDNPGEFLRDDSTLIVKEKYAEQATFAPKKNVFAGNIYVLINGGSFSAATNLVSQLYNKRNTGSKGTIEFIGEENGGDIYAQTGCAGQSYIIDLPNSNIKVDMPALCFGELNKTYPKKRLPDFKVYPTAKGLASGKDDVLEFALDKIKKNKK